jgi:hypothetical protein
VSVPPGIIDLHVHTGPDVVPRLHDDYELVARARAAGYRGLVLKSHVEGTAARARLARRFWPGGEIVGGLALNRTVGGLNPIAVEVALALGARVVWMPTVSAANQLRVAASRFSTVIRSENRGISLGDADFDPSSELAEICRLVARAGCVLATGHLSPAETMRLVPFARSLGVDHIVVTHPELPVVAMTLADQLALVAYEHVWFERCAVAGDPRFGVHLETIVEGIRQCGAERTILATDYGGDRDPVAGMEEFLALLADEGVDRAELELMTVQNPARALGLE